MNTLAVPLQLVPEFGVPGILSTLVIVVLAIVVARVVLSIALRVAVVGAVVVGILWFFGLLRFIPFL